jgi:mycoredoxin
MHLNNVQEASLRRLQRYRTHPPTLGERIRLSAMFMLGLLVPVAIAGFVLVQLDVPGVMFLLAGLYIGAVVREIGQQRLFVLWWPLNRHITDWNKVDELLISPHGLPDLEQPAAPRKLKATQLVALGVGLFAVIFVAAILIERALAFAHDPTRGNPPNNVIVLTTSWCGYCRTLRQHLAERNIPYTDLDVEHTTEGRYAFNSVRGGGVPITIVGSQVIRGVGRPDVRWRSIDGALSAAGYDLPSASQAGGQADGDWIDSALAR